MLSVDRVIIKGLTSLPNISTWVKESTVWNVVILQQAVPLVQRLDSWSWEPLFFELSWAQYASSKTPATPSGGDQPPTRNICWASEWCGKTESTHRIIDCLAWKFYTHQNCYKLTWTPWTSHVFQVLPIFLQKHFIFLQILISGLFFPDVLSLPLLSLHLSSSSDYSE